MSGDDEGTRLAARARYTSAACARGPGAADWSSGGLLCYAACGAVALHDTNLKGGDSVMTLHLHKSRVNAVKWIQNGAQNPFELISCSGDKTAVIWSKPNDKWVSSAILVGHTEGVTCADAIYPDENDNDHLIIYTASIDSTVRIWERRNGATQCLQNISLGSGLCLTLKVHSLPVVNKPVLFCAFDDDKIYLFFESSTDGCREYHKATALIGHEDWVRGLDVMTINSDSLLLASSSQDTYIRLWSVKHQAVKEQQSVGGIRVEQKLFNAYGQSWSTKLEAVLSGHEGWVYGVNWHPPHIHSDGSTRPVYKLLSSSLDKTMIIWEPEAGGAGGAGGSGDAGGHGSWVETVRVGEVGGNSLGFYGSKFGPDGKSFIGHGYNGSFHMWTFSEESNKWEPAVVCGGHFGEVVDVRWEPRHGRYITSVGADQTTRVHAPWSTGARRRSWCELARPQVHGFDMTCLALVSSTLLVSGAEEKVVRVFEAPHNFLQNFKNITKMELVPGVDSKGPEGASVPSLGLSNKAVFSGGENGQNGDGADGTPYFVPVHLTEPPTEETLMQNTLWPEIQKLYGHGYEVFTLDASPDGALVASACKATTAEHAAVLLWDTKEWQQVQKLVSHQLTVTQLAFSPDSARLVSVSRDRRWSLFRRLGAKAFELVASTDKTNGLHARIIWSCAWAHDSLHFATGSRDGKVCVWGDIGKTAPSSLGPYGPTSPPLEIANASVTALAFAPVDVARCRLLAVGLESGVIRIYLLRPERWTLALEMDNNVAHHLTVKRLAFRPTPGAAGDTGDTGGTTAQTTLQLASCGSDHLVRIYDLHTAEIQS